MKKLLSVILSATLVAGTAVTVFATGAEMLDINTENLNFDSTIYVDETEIVIGADTQDITLSSGSVIFVPFIVADEENATKENVTKMSDLDDVRLYMNVTEGEKYVEGYEIAKENDVYGAKITIDDYFGSEAVEISGELSLKNRKNGREIVSTEDAENVPVFELANTEETLTSKNGVAKLDVDDNTKIVGFDDDTTHIALTGNNFYFDVKASDQESLFLGVSNQAHKKISTTFENADLTFINFVGRPQFDFNGTLSIITPDIEEEYFLYEISETGRIKQSAAKFNKDDEVFEIKTSTLARYIISDIELDVEVYNGGVEEDTEDETVKPVNPVKPAPPTGAIV